jgi:hypothetical protein
MDFPWGLLFVFRKSFQGSGEKFSRRGGRTATVFRSARSMRSLETDFSFVADSLRIVLGNAT